MRSSFLVSMIALTSICSNALAETFTATSIAKLETGREGLGAHYSYGTTWTEFPHSEQSTALLIPRFNPKLGTLNGVDIKYTINGQVQWITAVEGGDPCLSTYHATARIKDDVFPQVDLSVSGSASRRNGSALGGFPLFKQATNHYGPTGFSVDNVVTCDLLLSEFFAGIVESDFVTGVNVYRGAGEVDLFMTAFVQYQADITYTYAPAQRSPVPEPSAGSLLLGACALAVRRRHGR